MSQSVRFIAIMRILRILRGSPAAFSEMEAKKKVEKAKVQPHAGSILDLTKPASGITLSSDGRSFDVRPGLIMQTMLGYILIALVAVCPYFCMGSTVEDAGVREMDCSYCHTCGSSGGECPDNSDNGEADCLCHGAILSKVESLDSMADHFCIHMAILPLVDNRFDGILGPALHESLVGRLSALSTGRAICELNCVLLL